jgi:hypothetical protein
MASAQAKEHLVFLMDKYERNKKIIPTPEAKRKGARFLTLPLISYEQLTLATDTNTNN